MYIGFRLWDSGLKIVAKDSGCRVQSVGLQDLIKLGVFDFRQ